ENGAAFARRRLVAPTPCMHNPPNSRGDRSMKKCRTAAVAVALLALAGLVAPGPARAQATTLALPATAVHFTPIYIAADAGLWKARGLDVKLPLIAGPGATNAVI